MASKLRWKAGALLVAVSTGCALFSKGGESPPSPFDVTVTAAQRLNPDDGGESLPTLVRLYQLKSAGKLETTSPPRRRSSVGCHSLARRREAGAIGRRGPG